MRDFDQHLPQPNTDRASGSLTHVIFGSADKRAKKMNSSYFDPQQRYQFEDPRTRQLYLYRADELQAAIDQPFANVEFIPAQPLNYVKANR